MFHPRFLDHGSRAFILILRAAKPKGIRAQDIRRGFLLDHFCLQRHHAQAQSRTKCGHP